MLLIWWFRSQAKWIAIFHNLWNKQPFYLSRGNTIKSNILDEINDKDESEVETIDEKKELELVQKPRTKKSKQNTNKLVNDNKGFFYVHKKPKNKVSNISIASYVKKNQGIKRQLTNSKEA